MPTRCQLRLQSQHQWWSSNRNWLRAFCWYHTGGRGRWDASSLGDLITRDSSAPTDLSCWLCCNALAVTVVQLLSRVRLFATPWTTAQQSSLSITSSQFARTRVHLVCDAIQPSHPLSSPSPPVFNLSQHQGLFQWVSSSHRVAKVLAIQLQSQLRNTKRVMGILYIPNKVSKFNLGLGPRPCLVTRRKCIFREHLFPFGCTGVTAK